MRAILTLTVLVPLVAGCGVDAGRQNAGSAQQPAGLPFQVQVVADFESPWALTFLPDGRMLITEKSGTVSPTLTARSVMRPVDGALTSNTPPLLTSIPEHGTSCEMLPRKPQSTAVTRTTLSADRMIQPRASVTCMS